MSLSREQIDQLYRKGLNTQFGPIKSRLAAVASIQEAAGFGKPEDDPAATPAPSSTPAPAAPEEPPVDEKPKEGDEKTDGFKEADEAIEDVDLDSMSPEGKLELIRIIIDSAQNAAADDDEFSDFMNKTLDILDEFQVVEEGEEGGDQPPADEPAPEGEPVPPAGNEEPDDLPPEDEPKK